jgi:hypothetical protein
MPAWTRRWRMAAPRILSCLVDATDNKKNRKPPNLTHPTWVYFILALRASASQVCTCVAALQTCVMNRSADLSVLWAKLVEAVGQDSPFTRSYLVDAKPVSFQKNVLVVGFDPDFEDHIGFVDNARNHKLIQTKLAELGHANCQVKFVNVEAFGLAITPSPEEGQSAADDFRKDPEPSRLPEINSNFGSKIKTKFLTLLFWLAAIGGVAWYFTQRYRGQLEEQKWQHNVEIQQQQKDDSIAALALKYNAGTNWATSLPDRGYGNFFTVDVANALIRKNGQFVAIMVELEDMSDKDGAFTAQFFVLPSHNQLAGSYKNLPIHLSLLCSKKQAEILLKIDPDNHAFGKRFAVVAKVESVSRPAFEVENAETGDSYQIDFSSTPYVFFAKGQLVDVIPLDF